MINDRKAVFIINSPRMLRTRGKKRGRGRGRGRDKKDKAEVESLLYEEWNPDGTKVFEFMMYTMEDVSRFFASYLNTEICHVRCEVTPNAETIR